MAFGELDQSPYELAERLGKFVYELGSMPQTEYLGWIAHFNIKAAKLEMAQQLARQKTSAN